MSSLFERWLYQPKHYLMSIIMVLSIFALAFGELSYSLLGKDITGKITHIEQREMESGRQKKKWIQNWNHYEFHRPGHMEPVTGEYSGGDAKVGDPVDLQYLSIWPTWSRPSSERKPWVGWCVLAASIVIGTVAVVLGREAQDPFAKARALRHQR